MKTANISEGISYETHIKLNEKRHLTKTIKCKMYLALVKSCISRGTNLQVRACIDGDETKCSGFDKAWEHGICRAGHLMGFTLTYIKCMEKTLDEQKQCALFNR